MHAATDVERELTDMFADILEREDVASDEDFFDAGGDSLRATRIISRVYRAYRVELTFDDLFDAPTPAELAQLVSTRTREDE